MRMGVVQFSDNAGDSALHNLRVTGDDGKSKIVEGGRKGEACYFLCNAHQPRA